MSLKVGLGACQEDLEVQGEIDFDFFEGDESENNIKAENEWTGGMDVDHSVPSTGDELTHILIPSIVTTCLQESEASSPKICLETVIPTPENYYGKESCSSDTNENEKKDQGFSFNPNRKYDGNEDALGSPLSSSSASEFSSSSSSLTLSDEDSLDETDSMTDVSPLPSICHSPMPRREPPPMYNFSKSEEIVSNEKCQRDGGIKFSGKMHTKPHLHKTVKVNQLMKAIKQLEIDQNVNKQKTKEKDMPLAVNSKQKKNPSFSNEEVRKIDQDNQNLLKRILAQQKRTKPNFAPVYTRPSSSSINRHRHQRQIEFENMALLQRLEAAKPCKDLSRSHLLSEFKRRPSNCSSTRDSVKSTTSSTSLSMPTSCRNSANTSGRSSTLTVPLCNKNATIKAAIH